MFGNPADKQTV